MRVPYWKCHLRILRFVILWLELQICIMISFKLCVANKFFCPWSYFWLMKHLCSHRYKYQRKLSQVVILCGGTVLTPILLWCWTFAFKYNLFCLLKMACSYTTNFIVHCNETLCHVRAEDFWWTDQNGSHLMKTYPAGDLPILRHAFTRWNCITIHSNYY